MCAREIVETLLFLPFPLHHRWIPSACFGASLPIASSRAGWLESIAHGFGDVSNAVAVRILSHYERGLVPAADHVNITRTKRIGVSAASDVRTRDID